MIKRILNLILKTSNSKDGIAILMMVFILSGILVASLGSATILLSGIKMSGIQENSTMSYFAAETGAERSLALLRKGTFNFNSCADSGQCIDFINSSCGNCSTLSYALSNGTSYTVEYASSTPYFILTSNGYFSGTKRTVKVDFLQQ